MSIDYDKLANQYKNYRTQDPRIAAQIQFHLPGAQRILNVGAGMDSYEPQNGNIVAIEPWLTFGGDAPDIQVEEKSL